MISISNQTHAAFGYGDILVGSFLASNDKDSCVGVFTLDNSDTPHEIGAAVDHPEDIDPFDVPVIFTFTNIQSLDVVIKHLNHLRSDMEAWENGDFEETPDAD